MFGSHFVAGTVPISLVLRPFAGAAKPALQNVIGPSEPQIELQRAEQLPLGLGRKRACSPCSG